MNAWRKLVALAAAAVLSACSLPPKVKPAAREEPATARADFRQCGLAVDFSGVPREFDEKEKSEYAAALAKDRTWQMVGLTYGTNQFVEIGVCLCLDIEFTSADLRRIEADVAKMPSLRMMPVDPLPFSRKTIAFEAPYSGTSVRDQSRFVFPSRSPRCMLVQGAKFEPSAPDAATTFFATLRPSP